MFKNPFAKKRPAYPENLRKDFKTFSIELPSEHPLLGYQKDHPKYDTFLPYLALHSKPSETILDIGANVGDTLVALPEDWQYRVRDLGVLPIWERRKLVQTNP